MKREREYRPQTAADSLRLIEQGVDPWLAVGQFVDDWHRATVDQKSRLVAEPLLEVSGECLKWAALLVAAVGWLTYQQGLPCPQWANRPEYRLARPWFLYPGWRLRAWQLAETPTPFRMRNIFGGDRILSRV